MESVRRQNEPQNGTRKLVCIYIANKYVIMCASMPVHMYIYIYVHCVHTVYIHPTCIHMPTLAHIPHPNFLFRLGL